MKTAAILVNVFFPGVGTFFVGKWFQAILQLLVGFVALIFILTGVGAIIGSPILFIVWVWAIVSAATAQSEPTRVIIVQQKSDG